MPTGPRAVVLLAAIVALGGVLRWGAMQATYPVVTIGDENYYAMTALQIARGRGHVNGTSPEASRAWRPPVHSYLLSLLADPQVSSLNEFTTPAFVRPMLLLQVVLSTALVALTALLGQALFDTRVGLVAGLIAALYPALIAHSHTLWSETLFGLLVTAALLGVVLVARERRWSGVVFSGLSFGVAALTREVALPVAAVAAFWWWWTARPEAAQRGAAERSRTERTGQRRRAALQGATMLALALLLIVPWTLRNDRVLGRFIPVSTVGWFAAGEGNTLEHPDWLRPTGPRQSTFALTYFEIPSEVDRLDFARRQTLERIAAEQPTWILKKTLRNLAQLGSPDSVLLYKLRRGAYGDVPAGIQRTATVVSIASYVLVFTAGVLGIATARGTGRRLLPCLVIGVVAGLHVVANATARFRVPWLPLLIVYTSYALTHASALPRQLRGRRWIAPAAVLLFFFAACVPYLFVYGGRR
jgi:4-amino-4-deoxy-L-arabinose transferase-like glycosyltransferase